MGRFISYLLLNSIFVFHTIGQNFSPFLFEEYQNALIFYKDGRQFQAPVNFDLLEGHYLFIDAKDKETKQFSNPELIALLRIGERRFLIGNYWCPLKFFRLYKK